MNGDELRSGRTVPGRTEAGRTVRDELRCSRLKLPYTSEPSEFLSPSAKLDLANIGNFGLTCKYYKLRVNSRRNIPPDKMSPLSFWLRRDGLFEYGQLHSTTQFLPGGKCIQLSYTGCA